MGIANWLGLGKDIAEPIKALGELYTTDKERLDSTAKLQEELIKPTLAQLENNRILNLSKNIFVSGWQSLLGWTAGFLVLIYYLPQIVITTYVWGHLCIESGYISPFPMRPDDITNLIYLLFGFGGYSLIKR